MPERRAPGAHRTTAAAAAAIAAAALLSACGTEEPTGTPLRWGVATALLGPAQSPYAAVPEALGYWDDEGLDVEVMGFEGSSAVVQALDAGQIDLGIAAGSSLFSAVEQGSPLVSFYDQVTRNYLVPTVPEDSPIDSPADFAGTTIGVQSLESGSIFMVKAMMARAGADPESADFVTIGTGAEALQFIKQGDIDVVALWDAPHAEIEEFGVPLREIADQETADMGFGQVLAADETYLRENRSTVVALARGIAMGSLFAEANPEAAVRLTWEVYPETKPLGVDEDVAVAQGIRVLEARQANTQPVGGVWGATADDSIEAQSQLLQEAGVISSDVTRSQLWTEDLLPEINDFDADAVERQAAEWSPPQ